MRLPSIKTLTTVFKDKAKQARAILETENTTTIYSPSVDYARKTAYNRHKKYFIKLLALSDLGGFYGVEYIQAGQEYAEYLNAGDTYTPTLIYWRGNYRVQSLGDFVESMEKQRIKFN